MSILTLQLPFVKRKTENRPQECPKCKGETFQRWGGVILIFSRFVVGARAALALVAGIGHYPTLRMFMYSTISYFLFVGLLMYIGIVLVENMDAIERMLRTYNLVVWPLLGVLVLFWIIRKVRQPKKSSRP